MEGARKWLKNEFNISHTKIHSRDWRADKNENTSLTIAVLLKLFGGNLSYASVAKKIVENLDDENNIRDTQTFEKLISEATKTLKSYKQ